MSCGDPRKLYIFDFRGEKLRHRHPIGAPGVDFSYVSALGSTVETARTAYAQRAWDDAYLALSRAGDSLEADDLERLAWSAMLTGRDREALEALERVHQLRLDAGESLSAARIAFWLAFRLGSLGETARASGWLVVAQRLVERHPGACVERGYLELSQVMRFTQARDFAAARAAAAQAAEAGDRFKDRDLSALARNLEGRTLIRMGRLSEGLPLLDEAMVAATSGALSPVVTGIIYCSVIAGCQQSYALDRAREWTSALSRWCDTQPQLVTFAGTCLIHRSEIMQLGGEWPAAVREARQACLRLSLTQDAETGHAHYQEGELHRVRGELAEAEQAYTRASELGRDPQPGLALLWLAQGRADAAAAATRRVLSVVVDPLQRTRFLPAHVEIMLAAGDQAEARRGADELVALATGFGMEILTAIARQALGSVRLAEGDARGAIAPLRQAQEVWQRVSAPYAAARARVLVAKAFRALGDTDGAALELDGAKKVFLELGAQPDVAAADALGAPATGSAAPGAPEAPHGLSPRELEVLLLVASGKTNKVIAKELFLSEKTVDRHVSNIFDKLDVPSRAAATAWAYQHGLVG